jgi:predicted secreted Zn-dependent protease
MSRALYKLALLYQCFSVSPILEANSEVKQSYSISYYEVPVGRYRYRDLVESAPKCVDGKRYIGCTTWRLRWTYRFSIVEKACRLSAFSVKVEGTIFLPKIPPTELERNKLLKNSIEKLLAHEEGHLDFPVQAAYRIVHEVDKLPESNRDCDRLARSIDSIGNKHLEMARALESRYDIQTRHGVEQGAVFNY